jgi:hypothetical protein
MSGIITLEHAGAQSAIVNSSVHINHYFIGFYVFIMFLVLSLLFWALITH